MDMQAIIEAGGVAAAAVVLVFGLYQALVRAKIIPKLKQWQGFAVIMTVVIAAFGITLVALTRPDPAANQEAANSGTQLDNVNATSGGTISIDNNSGTSDATATTGNSGTQLENVNASDGGSITINNE